MTAPDREPELRPGLRLVVGPPASGKTAAVVAVARAACRAGRRVWWLALPHQRPYVFRRVTAGGGAVLGLEVVGAQQAFYRVLSAVVPGEMRPLVVGTARVVLVAEAFTAALGRPPSPGEAKLFAAAIAEAKRFEVAPEALPDLGGDAEVERLRLVYRAYQAALGDRWDYDDVRSRAARLVDDPRAASALREGRGRSGAGLPDVVVVDGWRELGPLDWLFLEGLAAHVPVHVALPVAPPHLAPTETLAPRPEASEVQRHLAVNVVDEARWVLRSLKRDLACGLDPLDLAVVAPGAAGDALAALADEYGVPLADERGASLADTPEGRALLDLLELSAAPTPSRLLAVPELFPVAAAALDLGLTGAEALVRVARELGLDGALSRWLEALTAGDDPVAWTRWLLDEVLTLTQRPGAAFRERVLVAAQHAARLASGRGFQEWLAALLTDERSPRQPVGGVALLDADLASGRCFERCYVMGAVVGAYSAGEREDYFVPEDARSPVPTLGALPVRYGGRDDLVIAELLTRGRVTVVTAALGGPDGRLVPDERLLGREATPLPTLPAGSPTEAGAPATPYRAPDDPLTAPLDGPCDPEGRPDVEWLRELAEGCALRAWGEHALRLDDGAYRVARRLGLEGRAAGLRRVLRAEPEAPLPWDGLLAALKEQPELAPPRLAAVAARHPWAEGWLRAHAERLTCLRWNARVFRRDLGVSAYVDALEVSSFGRSGEKVALYRFVPPTRGFGWEQARELQRSRWTEYLAAGLSLKHPKRPVRGVEVWLWPVLGEPFRFEGTERSYFRERIDAAEEGVVRALELVASGRAEPDPGEHRCRGCRLAPLCREAALS